MTRPLKLQSKNAERYPIPPIITRDKWGAQKPEISKLERHEIDRITIFHSGHRIPPKHSSRQHLLDMEHLIINQKKLGDLPYHFDIDPDGLIYQCRDIIFKGQSQSGYHTDGHILICVMGDFDEQLFPKQLLASVVSLCAWLCDKFDIPPELIKGHRDYAKTTCPGRDLYRYIADNTIRRMVECRLKRVQIA